MTELTETLYNKDDELREKIGKCLNISPDEFKEYLPNAIGKSHIDELEKLIKQYGDQRELDGRIDSAKRFDGAYLRYLKHEATNEGEESEWIGRDELIEELTALKDKQSKED